MGSVSIILFLILAALIALIVIVLISWNSLKKSGGSDSLAPLQDNIYNQNSELKKEMRESREETLRSVQSNFTGLRTEMDKKFNEQAMQNEQKLEQIRSTMERRIGAMQDDNAKQLDKMRDTVDEKLQKTLESRISESFKLVNDRLEQVHKGLGEMQNLANGVGDLKKVLSSVKTRGTLGEIQLEAILEQILNNDQYVKQAAIITNSPERVDFAVKMPGQTNEKPVYLPIDSKFPLDQYHRLTEAYENSDIQMIESAGRDLDRSIIEFAKSINKKYIAPPETTDFAVMFLPIEGLYAEVVRRGLVERLQRDHKINIAGPTTMAAMLNSLQMGFRTLAIQKRSSEVWDVLSAVKTEFDTFGNVLNKAQTRITQANKELDSLIGTRTNVMKRKLRDVATLPEAEAAKILSDEAEDTDDMTGDANVTDDEDLSEDENI